MLVYLATLVIIFQAITIPDDSHNDYIREPFALDILSFYEWDTSIMLSIAWEESNYREMAHHTNANGSIDRGYLQINSIHGYTPKCLYNLACNIEAAYQIWKLQGYGAWSVY